MLAQLDIFVGPEVQWFALSPLLILLGGALGMLLVVHSPRRGRSGSMRSSRRPSRVQRV